MLPYPRWNPYAMTGAGESPRPTVEQIQGEIFPTCLFDRFKLFFKNNKISKSSSKKVSK